MSMSMSVKEGCTSKYVRWLMSADYSKSCLVMVTNSRFTCIKLTALVEKVWVTRWANRDIKLFIHFHCPWDTILCAARPNSLLLWTGTLNTVEAVSMCNLLQIYITKWVSILLWSKLKPLCKRGFHSHEQTEVSQNNIFYKLIHMVTMRKETNPCL
jgi:hypothetical protein